MGSLAQMAYVIIPMFIFAYMICKPIFADRKARGGITNYDSAMREYVFLLKTNQQTAVEMLSLRNISDIPEYRLDTGSLVITFTYWGVQSDYQLIFIPVGERTYLKVRGMRRLVRGNIPYLISSFFINKLGAAPVDYRFFQMLQSDAMRTGP